MELAIWLKKRVYATSRFDNTLNIISNLGLNTVCQSAKCPNIWDCFGNGIATFLILGSICTRNCAFCCVTKGVPQKEDSEEPFKIADAVKKLNLKHVVVTSVTRDDLSDKGATQFYKVVQQIRALNEKITIEVLTPDFCGEKRAIDIVLSASPDIYNHNLETVERLYPLIRTKANYNMSINLLKYVKKTMNIVTKSGIIVGLGETKSEVVQIMKDLSEARCDMLTIGQYIRPSINNIPVHEFIAPEKFIEYKNIAYDFGFKNVISHPFARSSLNVNILNEKNN